MCSVRSSGRHKSIILDAPVLKIVLDDVPHDNVRDQVVTFLIAGHEATSGLLSFATYSLMRNPHVLAQAYAEVDRLIRLVEGYLPAGYRERCLNPVKHPRGLIVDPELLKPRQK